MRPSAFSAGSWANVLLCDDVDAGRLCLLGDTACGQEQVETHARLADVVRQQVNGRVRRQVVFELDRDRISIDDCRVLND